MSGETGRHARARTRARQADRRQPARRAERRQEPARSQHFLRRGALASQLVERAALGPEDCVLEIGAGRGAITRELARRCRRVVAVEIDPGLCRRLRAELGGAPGVEIVQGDFLGQALPAAPFKVFANPPFRRSTAMLRRLLEARRPPEDVWLVLQLGSAHRFAGRPWAHETLTSLRLKPWWHAEIAVHLRRHDFDPPPSVESALLWLARRPRPLVAAADRRRYRAFLEAGFGRRGQTLRDSLRPLFTRPQLRRLAAELRIDLEARPSALRFEQWLGLFRFQP